MSLRTELSIVALGLIALVALVWLWLSPVELPPLELR
jgi:hypothetical protein